MKGQRYGSMYSEFRYLMQHVRQCQRSINTFVTCLQQLRYSEHRSEKDACENTTLVLTAPFQCCLQNRASCVATDAHNFDTCVEQERLNKTCRSYQRQRVYLFFCYNKHSGQTSVTSQFQLRILKPYLNKLLKCRGHLRYL